MQNAYNQHPVSPRLVAIVCVAYLLIGLLDHDLWKFEDAVHIGVAWGIAQDQNWLSPRLAGEVWDGMPLFHWLAAILGQLFGGAIGFHNAARLATAAFGGLLLYAIGWASGNLLASTRHGGFHPTAPVRFDSVAPLLLIGTPGLLLPVHEAQPMIAVLAGQALVYWGLIRAPYKSAAGVPLGLGLLLTFLAGGIDGLLPLAGLVLIPFLGPWVNRNSVLSWFIAAVIAGSAIAGWIFWQGLPTLPIVHKEIFSGRHFELLAWFVWPVLPLALWALWLQRRQLVSPHLLLPALGSIGALLAFFVFDEPRTLPALPILVPLTLLAASGVGRLRRGAANAFDWFAMMTFSLMAALVWLGAIALTFGVPVKLHKNIARLVPGFNAEVDVAAWAFAAAITVLWLILIFMSRRSPWRSTNHWACGTLLMWGLFAALWMPWVDHAKSYAAVTGKVEAMIAKHGGIMTCLAGQGLGDAQHAALHYHTGLVPKRGGAAKNCDWLLVQSTPKRGASPEGWEKVWEGTRPGDKGERFYLFKR